MNIDKSSLVTMFETFSCDKKLTLLQNVVHSSSIQTASSTFSSYNVPEKLTYEIDCKEYKVKNQHKTGFCWLFAAQNLIYHKTQQTMSVYYWAFFDKLERCNYAMNCLEKTKKTPQDSRLVQHLLSSKFLSDGGTWHMFTNILKKYGGVLEHTFVTTFHTKNTSEINVMLQRILRLFASGNLKRKKANKAILKILYTCFGTPPLINVINLYEDLNMSEYRVFINSPMHKVNMNYTVLFQQNIQEAEDPIYVNISIADMKHMALEHIKHKHILWFAADMGQVDLKQGIMDHELYDIDLLFDIDTKMSKSQRLIWGESGPVHAMVLCGAHMQGSTVTHWKVQNSWGEDSGKKGFFIMTDKWFEENVYQIVATSSQHCYPDTMDLPPWDPMGMLAHST